MTRWAILLSAVLLAIAAVATTLGIVLELRADPVVRRFSGDGARIGERTITVAELDEEWKRDKPEEFNAAQQQMYEGRRGAFERLLSAILVENAARSRGMSLEEFVDFEVRRRVRPVGRHDVLAFYNANVETLKGAPLEGIEQSIRIALERRNRESAVAAVVAELRQSGPSVRLLLDPPTHQVPVTDNDPALGDRHAVVTIVAFSDFQCPFCARLEPILKEVRDAYGEAVRVVWKDFPLRSIHPDAFKAAEATHCASEQRRYWEYHARLFANQGAMGVAELAAHASALGLEPNSFASCLDSSRYQARVQESLEAGASVGVQATPTVFVNGRALFGAQPFSVFARLIDEEFDRAGVATPRKATTTATTTMNTN